jgi:hypothetical protein
VDGIALGVGDGDVHDGLARVDLEGGRGGAYLPSKEGGTVFGFRKAGHAASNEDQTCGYG